MEKAGIAAPKPKCVICGVERPEEDVVPRDGRSEGKTAEGCEIQDDCEGEGYIRGFFAADSVSRLPTAEKRMLQVDVVCRTDMDHTPATPMPSDGIAFVYSMALEIFKRESLKRGVRCGGGGFVRGSESEWGAVGASTSLGYIQEAEAAELTAIHPSPGGRKCSESQLREGEEFSCKVPSLCPNRSPSLQSILSRRSCNSSGK
ncbi:hypothetical protein BDZ89DRAFT_1048040 [Hymenopellis radicata]|nr:hypothetical protein BDZ89DRAFT_1048040 [Hymenopellis radicata]